MRRLTCGFDEDSTLSQESYNNVAGLPFQQTPGNGVVGLTTPNDVARPARFFGRTGLCRHYAPFFTQTGEIAGRPASKTWALIGGNIKRYSPNSRSPSTNRTASRSNGRANCGSTPTSKDRSISWWRATISAPRPAAITSSTQHSGLSLDRAGQHFRPLLGAAVCAYADRLYAWAELLSQRRQREHVDFEGRLWRVVLGRDPRRAEVHGRVCAGPRTTSSSRGASSSSAGWCRSATNELQAMQDIVAQGQRDSMLQWRDGSDSAGSLRFRSRHAGPDDFGRTTGCKFDKLTGRLVADWTPKITTPTQTHLYASYARGYKAGGFNPGMKRALVCLPSYKPESIDAYRSRRQEHAVRQSAPGQYGRLVLRLQRPTGFGDREQHLRQPEHQCQALGRGRRVHLGAERPAVCSTSVWARRRAASRTANWSTIAIRPAAVPTSSSSRMRTLRRNVGQNCVIYMIGGQTVTPADNAVFQAL